MKPKQRLIRRNTRIFEIIPFLVLFTLSFKSANATQFNNWVHPYDSITGGFTSICFDESKNLYAAGYVRPNGRNFDSLAVSGYGYEDGIVCRMDSNGHVQWLKTIGAFSSERADFIFYKQNGLLIGGDVTNYSGSSSIHIDSVVVPIPTFGSVYNGYVMKLDTQGVYQWIHFVGGNIFDMKTDSLGNSYVLSGDFNTLFIDKISFTGNTIFHSTVNRNDGLIAPDFNGGIAIALTFSDSINFLGQQFYGYGFSDILLAQISPMGNFISGTVIGGAGVDRVTALDVGSNGNLILAGIWGTSVNCLGVTIVGDDHRFFVLSMNSLGNIDWYDDNDFRFLRNWSGMDKSRIIENSNHEYLTVMNFEDTVLVGQDTLTTHRFGGYDGAALILKYESNGQLAWYRKFAESTMVYNVGHASLFISESDLNKNYFCGQMNEPITIDSMGYNLAYSYIAYTGQMVDTTYDFILDNSSNQINENRDEAIVFPNPTNGSFRLNYIFKNSVTSLEILDLEGRKVYQDKTPEFGKQYHVNQVGVTQGLYFIKLRDGEISIVKKLLIN